MPAGLIETFRPFSALNRSTKARASSAMSPGRSRNGGSRIGITLIR